MSTADAISKKYGALDENAVAELISFPALFAYEKGQGDARLGRITRVRHRQHEVNIEYRLDPDAQTIPEAELLKLAWDLDLGDYEMNRTHWAVKDVDLLAVLTGAGLIKGGKLEATRSASGDAHVRPTIFQIPTDPRKEDLIALMTPFGSAFNGVTEAVKGACADQKLNCMRADDIWEASEVIQDVFSLIYRSRVVICDLTGRNPNVFYEAGIAHTLGRAVIPIAQHKDDVPFDLSHHRYLKYQNDAEGLEALRKALALRLKTLVSS